MIKHPEEAIMEVLQLPVFREIASFANQDGTQVYVVGGFVRDVFLQRTSKDVDILVVGDGAGFATRLAVALGKKGKLTVFKNFGTAQLKIQGFEVEFVGARKESYRSSSRKPEVVPGTLQDDLNRRDFTINALAISLSQETFGELIDCFDGRADMKHQLIRTPLEPNTTFSDDPLRMMRAIRFATQLQFTLHPETFASISQQRDRIKIISQERITDELNKIILSDKPSTGFKLLKDTGLLPLIFPEMEALSGTETVGNRSHKDNFYHTLQVLDNVAAESNDLWLRWAAILHDIGKPASKRYDKQIGWTFHGHEVVGERMTPAIFRRLKLPQNEKMKYVQKLVALHLRPIALTNDSVSDSAMRRLIVDAGEQLEDLFVLCRADITSKSMEKVEKYIRNFNKVYRKLKEVEAKDELRNWKPPITGEIIMDTFKLSPSKAVGEIKNEVKEAILNGDIPNSFDEAYEYMLEAGIKRGFKKK